MRRPQVPRSQELSGGLNLGSLDIGFEPAVDFCLYLGWLALGLQVIVVPFHRECFYVTGTQDLSTLDRISSLSL